MELVLGIDLGTTYSCAAWVDETGKPQIIKNKEGFLTTPSAVFFSGSLTTTAEYILAV